METPSDLEQLLIKLVAFPTVTGDSQSIHEAIDYIASFVANRGMHVERFDSNGFESLVATTKPWDKTPRVMLGAHLDVVPASEEQFVLRRQDGKYFGRGVYDMKFAIAAYLQIIDELQGHIADYDFGLMITADEEIGGKDGVAQLTAEGYLPQVCILPDGGDNWQVQTSSKGFLSVRFRTNGISAHGSRPWLGENAILPLIETVREVQALFPNTSQEGDTCSITVIKGGEALTQLPAQAEAVADIRYTNTASRKEILAAIQKICQRHGASFDLITEGGPTHFDLKNPFIAPFVELITKTTGVEVTGTRTPATNDARYFAPKGVPCISVYPTGGGHHGPEEWLSVKSLSQFKHITHEYLKLLAKRTTLTKAPYTSTKPSVDSQPVLV